MNKLVWTPKFVRSVKKLSKNNQVFIKNLEQVLKTIEKDVFHPILKTHKLKGDLSGYWACSLDYDNRIIFSLENESEHSSKIIILLAVGSHDVVY